VRTSFGSYCRVAWFISCVKVLCFGGVGVYLAVWGVGRDGFYGWWVFRRVSKNN